MGSKKAYPVEIEGHTWNPITIEILYNIKFTRGEE